MAAGRLISRNVAVSRKVCEASDWAFRVWATCLPFCDKHGRLPLDELDLAAICFPRMVAAGLVTGAKIAEGRDELLSVGLWKKTDDGLIEIVAFAENQSNQFRPDRETRGTYVVRGVIAEEVRSDCGVIAEEVRETPRNLNLKEKVEKEGESQARAREDAPPLDRPAVSGAQKQEAAAICDQVRDAFREALGSPHWPMTPKRVAKMAPYSGLLSGNPNLVAGFRVAIPAVRATGADETWLFENVLEYLSTNPRAGTTSAVALTGAPGHVPNTPTPDWVLEARAAGWTG